jgi:ribosomal protein S18 acetylase RimI-like enzyme
MTNPDFEIMPIRIMDLIALTQMTHENMVGADRHFTRMVSTRAGYWLSYLTMPFIFFFSGKGYKAVVNQSMVGCAYLNLRNRSGYVFNVGVRRNHRRQGIGYALMEHVETVAYQHSRRWMALQVDDGNEPAQNLYANLGYRPYHPNYFAGEAVDLRSQEEIDEVEIEHLTRYRGSRMFAQYLELERSAGDSWASEIIDECMPGAPGDGTYWRCLSGSKEIGCLRASHAADILKVHLVLKPENWDDGNAAKLTQNVHDFIQQSPALIEIHLGCSLHHEEAGSRMKDLGFHSQARPRILMLKRLA